MPIINISVKNKIATLDSCESIVCKNSDYMAHFTFDEDWNGYNVKLAKFIYNDKVIPRVFIGNDCAIPKLPNTYSCLIEVEAGDVKTSAPVHINCIPVGDNDDLEETEEYKTSVFNQILELIKNGTITSATIVKTEFVGKDANGGNVYKQIFDNGMESFFTAPKGDTVGIEFGETQGTAYEGNKGAKNSQDIIHILNEILLIQANITENSSSIAKLLLDVKNLTDRLNFIANSDDKTLDQLQEIVDFAKNNKNLIDTLNKIVDVDDIPENNFITVDKDKKLVDSGKNADSFVERIKNKSGTKFYYENSSGTHLLRGNTAYGDTSTESTVPIRYPTNAEEHPGTFEIAHPEMDETKRAYSAKHPLTVGKAKDCFERIIASEGLHYSFWSATGAFIGGIGSCTDTDIIIPPYYKGFPVTNILNSAFKSNVNITSVKIPSTVKSIGTSAFEGCTNLVNVIIPEGVETIGKSAFRGCTELKEVIIPKSVTYIDAYAFVDCTNINAIYVKGAERSFNEQWNSERKRVVWNFEPLSDSELYENVPKDVAWYAKNSANEELVFSNPELSEDSGVYSAEIDLLSSISSSGRNVKVIYNDVPYKTTVRTLSAIADGLVVQQLYFVGNANLYIGLMGEGASEYTFEVEGGLDTGEPFFVLLVENFAFLLTLENTTISMYIEPEIATLPDKYLDMVWMAKSEGKNEIFPPTKINNGLSETLNASLKIGDNIVIDIDGAKIRAIIQEYTNNPINELFGREVVVGWYNQHTIDSIVMLIQSPEDNNSWLFMIGVLYDGKTASIYLPSDPEKLPEKYLPMDILATKDDINGAIGEISTALDELHNYAQNLVSGVSE